MAPRQIPEVKGVWMKYLRKTTDLIKRNNANKSLYVTEEKSEAERSRYRAFGDLKDFVEELRRAEGVTVGGTIDFKWKPRFAILTDQKKLVAKVTASGELALGDDATIVRATGISSSEFRALHAQRG